MRLGHGPVRGLVTAFLLVAGCAGAHAQVQVQADDVAEKRAETIEGLIRVVGAQAGIVLYCRKFHAIDDKVSDGLSRTVRHALDEAVGRRRAEAAIEGEGKRVAAEIETVGAERWCADQRDILNTDHVRVFLD